MGSESELTGRRWVAQILALIPVNQVPDKPVPDLSLPHAARGESAPSCLATAAPDTHGEHGMASDRVGFYLGRGETALTLLRA